MAIETNTYKISKKPMAAASDSVAATAQNILDKGTDAYEKAEQVVGEAYDTTTQKVNETYEKAKRYGGENPGTSIFVALGIGVGIGLLLSARPAPRTFTDRIAQPVVNTFSKIAQGFLR